MKTLKKLTTILITIAMIFTIGMNTVLADTNSGITTFVTSLYSDCLGRTPDPTGLEDWSMRLATRQITGKDCAFGFFFSNEFLNKATTLTNDELIDTYYRVFLNRAADASGKSYWNGKINGANSELAVTILFIGFADSTEFANKCASYGINAGDPIGISVDYVAGIAQPAPAPATNIPNSTNSVQYYLNQGFHEYTLDLGLGETQRLLYRETDCSAEYAAVNAYRRSLGLHDFQIISSGPEYDYALWEAINVAYNFAHKSPIAMRTWSSNPQVYPMPRQCNGDNIANNLSGTSIFDAYLASPSHNYHYSRTEITAITIASVEVYFILPDGTITQSSPAANLGGNFSYDSRTTGRASVEIFW